MGEDPKVFVAGGNKLPDDVNVLLGLDGGGGGGGPEAGMNEPEDGPDGANVLDDVDTGEDENVDGGGDEGITGLIILCTILQ